MKTLAERTAIYETIATRLSSEHEEEISKRLADAPKFHSGWGSSVKLEIEGIPVFAKRIPLSDFEFELTKHPLPDPNLERQRLTANHFNLPLFYQYGIGSAGFGAWRELTGQEMASKWVLDGECPNFPLMYGYKIIERTPQPMTEEESQKLEERVKYWDNSPEVRERLLAAHNAKHEIVIFLENVGENVHSYLYSALYQKAEQKADQEPRNMAMLERELQSVSAFIESKNMIHFDAHRSNILTDGEQIYFADFGLATSLDFGLTTQEREFFECHRGYDRSLALSNCLGMTPKDKDGQPLSLLSLPEVEVAVSHYKPLSDRMIRFIDELRPNIIESDGRKTAVVRADVIYPTDEMNEIYGQLTNPKKSPKSANVTRSFGHSR